MLIARRSDSPDESTVMRIRFQIPFASDDYIVHLNVLFVLKSAYAIGYVETCNGGKPAMLVCKEMRFGIRLISLSFLVPIHIMPFIERNSGIIFYERKRKRD